VDDVTPPKSVWDSITGGNWELDLDSVPPFAPLHDVMFHKPITTTDNKTVPYQDISASNLFNPEVEGFDAERYEADRQLRRQQMERDNREFARRQATQQQQRFLQRQQDLLRQQDLARQSIEQAQRQQERQALMANWSDMNAALHGHGILGNPRILRPNDNYEKQSKPIPKAKPKKVERYEEPKRTLDLDHID